MKPRTDFLTARQRCLRMQAIRSKNTKLERFFFREIASHAHRAGYRYRKHAEDLPGRPDLAFAKLRLAVFIDSTFWHGYGFRRWRHKLRGPYWPKKIMRNIARDRQVSTALRKLGWSVLRFQDSKLLACPEMCLSALLAHLRQLARKKSRRRVPS